MALKVALQPNHQVIGSDPSEAELRIQLAAAYRLVAKLGMDDLIYTHITVRIPGPERHFLINPFGLMFHEVTASSLVKVDLEGRILDNTDWPINPAGFVIHRAIHATREDLHCVVHTHARYGMAVSALECGLLPISQFSLQFYDQVAYHDYEGVSLDLDECDRLAADLADKKVMILRNHGLLSAGRTVGEAFTLMYYLEKSCEVQILAQSAGSKIVIPPEAVCQKSWQQQDVEDYGQMEWAALVRGLDQADPSYRH